MKTKKINEYMNDDNYMLLIDIRKAPVKRIFKIDIPKFTDEEHKKMMTHFNELIESLKKLDR